MCWCVYEYVWVCEYELAVWVCLFGARVIILKVIESGFWIKDSDSGCVCVYVYVYKWTLCVCVY